MAKTKKTRKSPKTLKAIAEKLEAERDDLLHQLEELEHDSEEPYDDNGSEPETATYERERDLTLSGNLRDLLDKVEHALAKIDDETYGICESCGKNIEAARLKALPYALLCIACKRAEERP